MKKLLLFSSLGLAILISGCRNNTEGDSNTVERIPVILDTDANNELDDQHAIAYLLNNQDVFDIVGITVNKTWGGGPVEEHYKEALRILTLFNEQDKIALHEGANGGLEEIIDKVNEETFDGSDAVDFIIREAAKYQDNELVLIPIGKLTNIALAMEKAPEIIKSIRIVWLGSNYPDPGEYNLDNDTAALNYILASDALFEMVTVSYGKETGTSAILVSINEVDSIMHGKGPESEEAIVGRHGGEFSNFGDYSVDLFHHIDLYGDPPSRSLFDVGAVAVVKNADWAKKREIPAPFYGSQGWIERPENERKIEIWEHFDKEKITGDFYESFNKY